MISCTVIIREPRLRPDLSVYAYMFEREKEADLQSIHHGGRFSLTEPILPRKMSHSGSVRHQQQEDLRKVPGPRKRILVYEIRNLEARRVHMHTGAPLTCSPGPWAPKLSLFTLIL